MSNLTSIEKLGFSPKENVSGIFEKKYTHLEGEYCIEIDFKNEKINFGNLIKAENKSTQNFSQAENWVVLDCVDRLLQKGYAPQNITLEKTYRLGHNNSGRLDILLSRDNGEAYLMIECKTWGKEFDKAFVKLNKDGGQLFSYFQQDKSADILMLYASNFDNEEIEYRSEIVKIEAHYKKAANIADFYDRWNKITNPNGIFEEWVNLYQFQNKLLTKKDLKPISEADSGFIFHQFLAILRKHSVSDKPNAFNKIFNLFLAKIFDEKKKASDELEFQWKENQDNDVDFQVRLINLHKRGIHAFLQKEIEGIDDEDFNYRTKAELQAKKKKLLKFNNVFAIKEVMDDESFDDNARVLREVVELLKKYQIRYPRKQIHLSNFFERLLTTGLKQESGQFFTPIPITRFIIKSLPINKTITKYLTSQEIPELPAFIDYAAGSGHFLTEVMEEVQNVIDTMDTSDCYPDVEKQIKAWQLQKYDWAAKYIYGIEKDYRLVKVAKVGCYFYGDGLAQVIHGDGLDSFYHSKSYKGLLKQHKQANELKKFDFVVSNPPYSVPNFKGDIKNVAPENEFELYKYFTDNSKEIEALFIERTKQLLKIGGLTGIVLPSSILSNTGLYTKTREIILQYFEIIAITKLGSNTFMATGTNTVILFLRRRNDNDCQNFRNSVEKIFDIHQDITVNGIQNPVNKYLNHVWEGLSFEDYKTLLQKSPNQNITEQEIYQDYSKKIKAKNTEERLQKIIDIEKEKIFYFILAYPQKIVLIDTGDKKEEKRFLGYEFSNRRGSEGIHPTQRGRLIEDCTRLFDAKAFENPEKASTYIYQAFQGELNSEIPQSLEKNVSRVDLVDMMTFDRVEFEKKISVSVKKKVKYEQLWGTDNLALLGDISQIQKGKTITAATTLKGEIPVVAGGKTPAYYHNQANREGNIITISASGAYSGFVNYFDYPIFASDCNTIKSINESEISTKLIYLFLKSIQKQVYTLQRGQAQPHVYGDDLANIKIPLLPKEIQEKIVSEIEVLEKKEKRMNEEVESLKFKINTLISNNDIDKKPLSYFLKALNPNKTNVIKGFSLETKVSFLKMEDVSNDAKVINLQTRELKQVKTGYTFFQENDILFAKITPCTENGKGALVPKLENNIGFGSTEFYVLRVNELILPKILFYITKTKRFRIEAENNMTGTSGHRRVPKSFIESYRIPNLSLSEQQKIVSEIENLENKIEELEQEITLIPNKKELILKKYLE